MNELTFVSVTPLRALSTKSEYTAHVCGSDIKHKVLHGEKVISGGSEKAVRHQIICAAGKADKGKRKPAPKGLFGRLKEALLRPIVTVPGSGGGDLVGCVFCKGSGFNDCDGCKGSGKDSLGTCLMCGGKTYLECTVCRGVGTVDRVRRGGTDDSNQYVVKNQRKS